MAAIVFLFFDPILIDRLMAYITLFLSAVKASQK